MNLNYIYGQPAYLVKKIITNVENNRRVPTHKKEELLNNIKGKPTTTIFMGYKDNYQFNPFMNTGRKEIPAQVEKIIMSAYMTHKVVMEAGCKFLAEPEVDKIKDDINVMLSGNKKASDYLRVFNNNFKQIIANCKSRLFKNWKDGKPGTEIMEEFGDMAYFYKERQYKNTRFKWMWMNSCKNEQEVANGLVERGIYEINDSLKRMINNKKFKCAIVKEILAGMVANLTEEQVKKAEEHKESIKKEQKKQEINNWFNKKSDKVKTNIVECIARNIKCQTEANKIAYTNYMINEFGYNKSWITNGRMQFTKEIKDFMDLQTKRHKYNDYARD